MLICTEGDINNADYWYNRSNKKRPQRIRKNHNPAGIEDSSLV